MHDARHARDLDRGDALAAWRDRFAMPEMNGEPVAYLCGNSLGLMPVNVPEVVQAELEAWASMGVDAHFRSDPPWYSYHEVFRETGARLVGGRPGEVVMMNSLTVNLHLMLMSFYRPEGKRRAVLMEEGAFPSDRYAMATHLAARGVAPEEGMRLLRPRADESLLRAEDIESALEAIGSEVALVLLGGVNYYTGQLLDIPRITKAAHTQGCLVGFDLAHAAGNVPLELHAWEVDFAVWCSYKYLNAGPGAVAGCFVHERHGTDPGRVPPRLAGWWGHDPATRFAMDSSVGFMPQPGAEGWQVSNPSILAMAPLRASLDIFESVGLAALRAKSVKLTGYLSELLGDLPRDAVRLLTPEDSAARGCQLSYLVPGRGPAVNQALHQAHVVADYRAPDVVRLAPVPLYNSFEDVWRAAAAFRRALEKTGAG